MATYAAYRHVELDKVGCGKRSIMKPPGGDCHDIFGADFQGTPSHHRVLKPPGGGTSGLFDPTPEESEKLKARATASRNLNVQTSNNVLNGNELKTNGLNGKTGNESLSIGKDSQLNQHPRENDNVSLSSRPSTISAEIRNLSAQEEKRRRDGNPVTGEGYDTPETQAPAPARARIPPGGYSSGLW